MLFSLFNFDQPFIFKDETMKLFYDMTFELGDLFVTILTFTNYFYVGCPVMPLAVNIHERKFKSRYLKDRMQEILFHQRIKNHAMQRRLYCNCNCMHALNVLCKIIESCSLNNNSFTSLFIVFIVNQFNFLKRMRDIERLCISCKTL